MDDHPTLEELQGLWREDLPAGRSRAVVRHLLGGCGVCRSRMAPHVGSLFGIRAARVTASAAAVYDSVLDRVLSAVLYSEQQASESLREALAVLSAHETAGPVATSGRRNRPSGFEMLLERCQAVRYDDPAQMVDLAELATLVAGQLDPRTHGARPVADLRCRAWIELGNAFRVADRLDEAAGALDRAARHYLEGTTDPLLGARLFDIQASLDANRRRFQAAFEALDVVHAVYRRHGDRHLAGRVLLKKGFYTDLDGDPEKALQLLGEGLALVDRERDPALVFGAVHNVARSLMARGCFEEARELLRQNQRNRGDAGGRLNRLRLLWLEGQIDVGLGDLDPAERSLSEVKREFEAAGLSYTAAVVGLELAAVHLRRGQAEAARAEALAAVEVFAALRVHREALAAVLLLRDAFEMRTATAALLQSVVEFMTRAEADPSARFEPRFQ